MGVAKAKRQCGRQKCFLRCLFYVLKYKTAYTFLLSIVVSINAAFPRLPLVPRGHVLSLYEERTQRRTKKRNPRFPSLAPPLLRLFVRKKEMLPLCCAPISLWIASAFALQKLIREICMTPRLHFLYEKQSGAGTIIEYFTGNR